MTERPGGSSDAPLASRPGRSGRARFTDLLPRAISGAVLMALAIGTAVIGGQAFGLVWWVASLVILWEWHGLIGGPRQRFRIGIGGVALSLAGPLTAAGLFSYGLVAIMAGALLTAVVSPSDRRFLAAMGLCYAAALELSLVVLRHSDPLGVVAVLWLFAVVWGTDIAAYFAGRLIGGPKLWKRVSPSKTWAGFLVGIAAGALAGLAVAPSPGPYGIYYGLGLVVATVSQGGDLFESMLKRRFGVKDSSRIIPGHGGVMDRLDGFLAAAVFVASLGVARFGVDGAAFGIFLWR